MFPTPSAARGGSASRRSVLGSVGAFVGVATAGCSGVVPSGPEGEGDTIEILVENGTQEAVTVAVRVDDEDGAALFSRVYELDPGHLDESAGVDARPSTVRVFTADGASATWAYDPDVDLDCDGVDVGITVADDGIESWYGC